MRIRVAALLGLLLSLALSSKTFAGEWIQTWGAAPMAPLPAMAAVPTMPTLENQTIRQNMRISVGGRRIRIRFTNEFGTKPLTIGAARVALADEAGIVPSGTGRTLLFSGKPTIVIPAGAPYLSDPADLSVEDLATVSVSIYLPGTVERVTCHVNGWQTTRISEAGDYTAKDFTPKQTLQTRFFVSGVQSEVANTGRAVVVLGDSISDGDGSTPNRNRRWPDILANRLSKQLGRWGVVNMGIGGNRVLSDGAGQSALSRFDRDVLSVPGVRALIIFEGINDLAFAYGHLEGPSAAEITRTLGPQKKVTADMMIASYRQLIERARARGIKVIAATITPYEGSGFYSEVGETVRQEINAWIRAGHEFDGVLDFDAVVREPSDPHRFKEGFQPGDHIHGSDAGYAAMADSIDLSLFK